MMDYSYPQLHSGLSHPAPLPPPAFRKVRALLAQAMWQGYHAIEHLNRLGARVPAGELGARVPAGEVSRTPGPFGSEVILIAGTSQRTHEVGLMLANGQRLCDHDGDGRTSWYVHEENKRFISLAMNRLLHDEREGRKQMNRNSHGKTILPHDASIYEGSVSPPNIVLRDGIHRQHPSHLEQVATRAVEEAYARIGLDQSPDMKTDHGELMGKCCITDTGNLGRWHEFEVCCVAEPCVRQGVSEMAFQLSYGKLARARTGNGRDDWQFVADDKYDYRNGDGKRAFISQLARDLAIDRDPPETENASRGNAVAFGG